MNKQFSLSKMIVGIVASIMTVASILIFITITYHMKSTLETNDIRHVQDQSYIIVHELKNYIDLHRIALEKAADLSFVKMSIRPDSKDFDIRLEEAFLQSVQSDTILKNTEEYILLDSEKRPQYFNTSPEKTYESAEWVNELLIQNIDHYIEIVEENEFKWLIAVPVYENKDQNVSGVLISKIPVAEIFNYFRNNVEQNAFQIKFVMTNTNELIDQVGGIRSGITNSTQIEPLNLSVILTYDNSQNRDIQNQAVLRIFLIILFFTLIAIVALIRIWRIFIIRPLRNMIEKARAIAQGEVTDTQTQHFTIKEVNELSNQFCTLAQELINQEKELIIANQSIEEKKKAVEQARNELENTQGQMFQQEKLASIGHLAAGVAHELNNPIGFVSSNFGVLKDYFDQIVERVDHLATIYPEIKDDNMNYILNDLPELISESQQGLDRVTQIVLNLRNFSRIDNMERSDYNLNEGVESTLIIAKNEYKYIADINKNLGDIPYIDAVGSEINDVIMNLIVNAAQAIASLNQDTHGQIDIDTYVQDKYVCLRITDDGPGIHESVIGKIFDPFFTTKEPGKGTGLGLNIAYNTIVNKHNGEFSVDSEFGKGATFYIKLPFGKSPFIDNSKQMYF